MGFDMYCRLEAPVAKLAEKGNGGGFVVDEQSLGGLDCCMFIVDSSTVKLTDKNYVL